MFRDANEAGSESEMDAAPKLKQEFQKRSGRSSVCSDIVGSARAPARTTRVRGSSSRPVHHRRHVNGSVNGHDVDAAARKLDHQTSNDVRTSSLGVNKIRASAN
jgi:hypothetical protein